MKEEVEYFLNQLENAFVRLKEVASDDVDLPEDFVRDIVIQRFEFTYELAWKTLKRYFENLGVNDISYARNCFKQAFKDGLIASDDELLYLQMIEDRNKMSHTYNLKLATEISRRIREKYYLLFEELLIRLKKKVSE